MVLDPIPQILPVHFFWVSTPAPHLSIHCNSPFHTFQSYTSISLRHKYIPKYISTQFSSMNTLLFDIKTLQNTLLLYPHINFYENHKLHIPVCAFLFHWKRNNCDTQCTGKRNAFLVPVHCVSQLFLFQIGESVHFSSNLEEKKITAIHNAHLFQSGRDWKRNAQTGNCDTSLTSNSPGDWYHRIPPEFVKSSVMHNVCVQLDDLRYTHSLSLSSHTHTHTHSHTHTHTHARTRTHAHTQIHTQLTPNFSWRLVPHNFARMCNE